MAMTVTATQGGSTANGLVLRVIVLTGAKNVAGQTGASTNNQFLNATAFTQSITTTANSNVYGGSSHGPNVASTGSNATIVDDIADATNNERYVTFKALNVTAAATTRGYTCTTASGPFAQLEILTAVAGTPPAEDASGPAGVSTTSALTVTTASFTPPNGSLLVAMVGSDGGAAVTTMTVSGGGLTWTEKVKNNPSGGDYAGVWIANGPAAGVAGSVQELATVPVPRRRLSRVLFRGGTGTRAPGGSVQPQPTITPPRRKPARAVVEFTPVTTTNQAITGVAVPPPVQLAKFPRLSPQRAYIRFTPVTTVNAGIPGNQQPWPTVSIPRRKPARATIQFTPVTTTNAPPPSIPGTTQPRPTLTWPRRKQLRAVTAVMYHPVRTTNAPPAAFVPALSPTGAGGSIEGELWRMARDGDWPKRPPGFGPVGEVPTTSAPREQASGRGWVGKRVRRFFWPREED